MITVKRRTTFSSNQRGYLPYIFLYSLSQKDIEAFFQCAELAKTGKITALLNTPEHLQETRNLNPLAHLNVC